MSQEILSPEYLRAHASRTAQEERGVGSSRRGGSLLGQVTAKAHKAEKGPLMKISPLVRERGAGQSSQKRSADAQNQRVASGRGSFS